MQGGEAGSDREVRGGLVPPALPALHNLALKIGLLK